MKKQDIKKIISEGMKTSMPNIVDKIDLNSIVFEAPIEEKTISRLRIFSKLLPKLSLVFIAILALVVFISIDYSLQENATTGTVAYPLASKEELYSFTSVSSSSLLKLSLDESITGPLTADSTSAATLNQNDLKFLNSYLNAFEIIIGNKETMSYQVMDSDKPNYEEKIVFSTVDLLGKTVSYTIYYTNDYSLENKVLMNGSLIIGNIEFVINAFQNIETLQFQMLVFAANSNDQNYVKLMSYVENDIQKMSYELYKNSYLIHKSVLDVKDTNNSLELVLKVSQESSLKKFNISKVEVNGLQKFRVGYEVSELSNQTEAPCNDAVVEDSSPTIPPSTEDSGTTPNDNLEDPTSVDIYGDDGEFFVDPYYDGTEMTYLYKYSYNIQDSLYEFFWNRFFGEYEEEYYWEDEEYSDDDYWYEDYYYEEDSDYWYDEEGWRAW